MQRIELPAHGLNGKDGKHDERKEDASLPEDPDFKVLTDCLYVVSWCAARLSIPVQHIAAVPRLLAQSPLAATMLMFAYLPSCDRGAQFSIGFFTLAFCQRCLF